MISMKSKTDDGLSSCSNCPEIPTDTKLAANKPVLPEIEHLKGKISDEELDSLMEVMNWNADVFSKHEMDIEEGSVTHREGAGRMTPHQSEACRKKLMEYGMIEPSKSPWTVACSWLRRKEGNSGFVSFSATYTQ